MPSQIPTTIQLARSIVALMGSIAVCIGLFAGPASAFDTGHHFDLTRDALLEAGFNDDAIRATQVCNWLTDYYSEEPALDLKDHLRHFHFDNLEDYDSIARSWGHFTANSKAAISQAARDGKTLEVIALLGISLHVVQDFYTHSNWPETFPRDAGNAFRTETWFSVLPTGPIAGLRTGAYPGNPATPDTNHGEYDSGLNHDSYCRPRWEESYVFAFVASVEWIAAVRSWVDVAKPGLWAEIQAMAAPGGLDADFEAAFRISEWVAGEGADGHWKGKGSGSVAEFGAAALAWAVSPDSALVDLFKKDRVHERLAPGLGDGSAAPETPPVPRVKASRDIVRLKTTSVREKDDAGVFELKIDSGGKADFYAVVNIAGLPYLEAMQIDRSDIAPRWTTLRFLPAGTVSVPITYQLFDEDGLVRGDDDHCDILPGSGRDLSFDYDLSAGSTTKASSGSDDSDRAEVEIEIATLKALPQPALAIADSVGEQGANVESDVRIVQALLNAVPVDDGGPSPRLTTDGLVGPKTIEAIRRFQTSQGLPADGRVDAGGQTLARLNTYWTIQGAP
jgi:hypothetical protein